MNKIVSSLLMLCMAVSAWAYDTATVTLRCDDASPSPFTVVAAIGSIGADGDLYWEIRNGSSLKLKAQQGYYITKVEFAKTGDEVETCDKLQQYTPKSWVRPIDDTDYYDVITFSNENNFTKVASITITYYHVCSSATHHAAVPGTCTAKGTKEHWECACGKVYSDDACTVEVTDLATPVNPANHGDKLKEVAHKNASVTDEGILHHWHCDACGNDYADADAKTDITGRTLIARHVADALLVSSTTLDESYLLGDGATLTIDGDDLLLDIDGDRHAYTLGNGDCLTIDFSHTFRLTANEDPDSEGHFYATFFTSEGACRVPETAKACTGEVAKGEDNDVLHLTATTDGLIPASEAVIVRATQSDVILMPSCSKAAASADNMLQGSDEPMMLPANSYALSLGQHGVGFYNFSCYMLPANKAFLTLAAHSGGLRFSFGDATDLDAPTIDTPANAYNLQGQQVDDSYRGIVIINGKKKLNN